MLTDPQIHKDHRIAALREMILGAVEVVEVGGAIEVEKMVEVAIKKFHPLSKSLIKSDS